MAGAMRKMGIYLGLVEDDERRAESGADYDADYDYSSDYGSGHSSDYSSDYRYSDSYADRDTTDRYADRTAERTAERTTTSESATEAEVVVPASRSVAAARWSGTRATAVSRPEPNPYRITTLHPRTYNEARTIGEHFREGVPVIMNLTEMDDSDAKRLVDFAAGLSFGLRGSIERVTNKVFLISPQDVSVTAEDKARIAEGGFFNQS